MDVRADSAIEAFLRHAIILWIGNNVEVMVAYLEQKIVGLAETR
jgi:hypothetical protein